MDTPKLSIIAGSCVLFLGFNKFIKHKAVHLYFKNHENDSKRSLWLWRNTFCSLIHSVSSSLWTILCYQDEPMLLVDMVNASSTLSVMLLSFSTGYFIYDYIDIVSHDLFRQWELIFHHTAVITAFSVALSSNRYMGFGVCSLLMEFNSIFLHIRRLMKLAGHSSPRWYKLNGVLLQITLLFFRVCLSCWMLRWVLRNKDSVPAIHLSVGLVGMIIMIFSNVGLMYRLWLTDFCSGKHEGRVLTEIKK